MGHIGSVVDEKVRQFIAEQRVFFVASAPLDPQGHVNLSPKGLDTFRILNLTGSGVETIAHVRENGRIVIMFCAFEGPPKIVRLHGRGRVVEAHEPEFESLKAHFGKTYDGERSIIVVELSRVSDSCGFAVPRLRYEEDRNQLDAWARKKGPDGLEKYRSEKNRTSLDGLPGTSD